MIEISKELFNEVMGNVSDIYNMKVVNDYLFWDNGYSNQINIYELAHKCKEWAFTKGYIVISGATTSNDWCSTICKVIKENPYIEEVSHTWEQTEVEAIFKACEWILHKTKES